MLFLVLHLWNLLVPFFSLFVVISILGQSSVLVPCRGHYGWQRPLNVSGDLLSVLQCIVLPHQRLPKKFQAPQKAKSIEGVAVFG